MTKNKPLWNERKPTIEVYGEFLVPSRETQELQLRYLRDAASWYPGFLGKEEKMKTARRADG